MGRLQGESCCPQPDWGNPAVRDETGGRRKLTEARNEAPACSDEEPVTATPRCRSIQRLRSTQPGCGNPACPDPWRGLCANMIPTPTHLSVEREGHHRHPDAQLRASSMVDFLLGLSLPRPYAV